MPAPDIAMISAQELTHMPDNMASDCRYAKPEHKQATRMLGYCLTLADTDTWLGAIEVLRARLDEGELTAMAFVTMKAQHPDNAALTAEAVLGRPGTPDVPFFSEMDQAIFWADSAEPGYIEACVLSGFNRMPQDRQAAFKDHINGGRA